MSLSPIELVYKEIDGLKIKMDVYIPSAATPQNRVPAVIWWHGGGLLLWTRKSLFPHQLSAPDKYNVCMISVDYRFAPQTRLPGILEDCKDAIEFLHSPEFAKATGDRIDPSNLVLSGGSAGGWLSLLCGTGIGFKASGLELPRPVKGIAALYPMTDMLHPFWKTKQRPVSYMDHIIPDEQMKPFVDPNAPKICETSLEITAPRNALYHYMIQEAILESLLLDGTSISAEAFSIAQNLRSKEFKTPPTYIVHGTGDQMVPIYQSKDVIEALKDIQAEVEYREMEGLDHLYDMDPKYELEDMYSFVLRCTSK
ncbi:Alpha/Beta hydrolase protein [Cyathus striatus]|nr:Alpha/Beta hydrolase protein [Cyathus striatus]